jgi:hypothetical protein
VTSDNVREFHLGWLLVSNDVFGAMISIFAVAAIYRLYAAEELILSALGVWVLLSR